MIMPIDHLSLPDSLSDGAVILDGYEMADAEAHLLGEDDEMLRRFEAPHRATLETTQAAIRHWMDARAAGGPMFAYALRQPSRSLVGGCELRLLERRRANVSYWVFPQYRNRGYGTRALTLLCDSAAKIYNDVQFEARIEPDNIASRRVAEKAGFINSGPAEDVSSSGTTSDRILYVRRALKEGANS
jgi:RimJ/RimL family protein N-acetyltransferase